ncbi:MAG: hypothetical protein JXM70_15825 [Pirellulales bacterium]|nr:hypothetical protein [Pirellulales bacterium]
MISKLIEIITGKDDLERVAAKENMELLDQYLKTRKILIPRKPKRFLDADSFTQDELLELIEQETTDLANNAFEPWILDVDGKMRLPAFSGQKKLQTFSAEISQKLDKVFSLGSAEVLLADIAKSLDVDFIDLNLYSQKSWEIAVRNNV